MTTETTKRKGKKMKIDETARERLNNSVIEMCSPHSRPTETTWFVSSDDHAKCLANMAHQMDNWTFETMTLAEATDCYADEIPEALQAVFDAGAESVLCEITSFGNYYVDASTVDRDERERSWAWQAVHHDHSQCQVYTLDQAIAAWQRDRSFESILIELSVLCNDDE